MVLFCCVRLPWALGGGTRERMPFVKNLRLHQGQAGVRLYLQELLTLTVLFNRFISDIGATSLQALFIVCAAIQGLCFVMSLAAERYLRHAGRLHPLYRRRERVCTILAIILSIPGQLGILFVAVFNTNAFPRVHVCMLGVFLVFTGLSIICTAYEFLALNSNYREVNRLRVSGVIKLIWLAIAIIFAICFVVFWKQERRPVAAVFEWTLSFWYGFYMFIYAYDLYPAAKTPRGLYLAEEHLGEAVNKRVSSWVVNPGTETEDHEDNSTSDHLVNAAAAAGVSSEPKTNQNSAVPLHM